MRTLPRILHPSGMLVIGVSIGLFNPSSTRVRGAEPGAANAEKKADLGRTELEPDEYLDLLGDLQGNILEDHQREHAEVIFLKIEPDRAAVAKQWIRDFATRYVTSAVAQRELGNSGVFYGFYLSASGYGTLGIPATKIPEDDDFTFGLKNPETVKKLGDPDPAGWEKPYQGDIDAMILVGSNDRGTLASRSADIQNGVRGMAKILTTESISNLRDRTGQEIEHFGFADSVSQPLFFKAQIERQGRSAYDPSAPLKLVLVPDPNGRHPYSCGSYLVVRKLRQDVSRFREGVEEMARTLKIDPELAAAYVIGRFRDGTPVALSSSPRGVKPPPNDFNFAGDADGTKCPFHAHILKMNPRGSTADHFEKIHRIVRRSMMYGVGDDGQPRPDGDVGMLFQSFQANINNQFAFHQKDWANTDSFPRAGTGPDPLIGQLSKVGSPTGQDQEVQGDDIPKYPREWGKPGTQPYNLARCVTMRGGEYFFAPSLSFLKDLE
jgi:Dyp-type peroxidase family